VTTVLLAGRMASSIEQPLVKALGENGLAVEVEAIPDYSLDRFRNAVGGALVVVTPQLGSEVIYAASRLRFVQCTGTGVDRIDTMALDPDVVVATTGGHGQAMAEYVIGTAIVLARRLLHADRALRRGSWAAAGFGADRPGADLAGRRATIVGSGRVAEALIPRLHALGLVVTVIARRTTEATARLGTEVDCRPLAKLNEVLSTTELLIVAVPRNALSLGLIDAGRLHRLPPDAIVVNIARGGIVDEEALISAVRAGKLAGAAIDVWSAEPPDAGIRQPPTDIPFRDLDNLIVTPHLAGWSLHTSREREGQMVGNVIRFLRGEKPERVLPRAFA